MFKNIIGILVKNRIKVDINLFDRYIEDIYFWN